MLVLVAWTSGQYLSGTCMLTVDKLSEVEAALEQFRVDYNWRKRPAQLHAKQMRIKSFIPESEVEKIVFKNGVITL